MEEILEMIGHIFRNVTWNFDVHLKHFWSTAVWNELEKENKEFFEAYSRSQKKEDRMSEAETNAMIQKIVSDHDHNDDDDDDDEENPKDPED